mgnify:CR=1 FL=1
MAVRRIDAMSPAEAKKVTASIAMAHAGLPAATISAPIAGPAIDRMLLERPRSAVACWRGPSPTASLTSPVGAGRENAAAVPNPAPKTLRIEGQTYQLSAEQYTKFQEFTGTKAKARVGELMQNPRFLSGTDEQQAKLIASVLADINKEAKDAEMNLGSRANLTKKSFR